MVRFRSLTMCCSANKPVLVPHPPKFFSGRNKTGPMGTAEIEFMVLFTDTEVWGGGGGGGDSGPSPGSATFTICLYSKITSQGKLCTSKPTTIRLREIRSLDKSKTSCPCVLYPHISRRARSESGVKPVFCLAILARHEVTAAIVRAIHPDLQTYKFN